VLRRRAARILCRIVASLVAIPLLYVLAALVLGTIPVNRAWQEPSEGVTVFIRSNGVHTWVMMPVTNDYMDWRPYAPAGHLRDPRTGNKSHVAVGFGHREFYLYTPTWADLSVGTAARAMLGIGPALLHVEHHDNPQPDSRTRAIRVTPEQYRQIAQFIRGHFQLDEKGGPQPVLGRGYGPNDMFYESHGVYNLVVTCNEWTGRALRRSGVRMGVWTPFAQSIMWRLD
jgi:uncharacterized protein (TIGR02117 family)